MNILYLSHRIPYPPNKGDKIRSFNEIKFLSQSHNIDLVCLADEPDDLLYAAALKEYCRYVEVFPLNKTIAKIRGVLSLVGGSSISVGYFYQQNMQQCVDRLLTENSYDAVLCFSSTMAEYIFKSSSAKLPARLIMDFCDVDSDKWLQYATDSRFPMSYIYRLENRRLIFYEKLIYQAFHASILISEAEKSLFLKICSNDSKMTIVPNGVDFEYFSSEFITQQEKRDHPVLVFTGAMDYHANVDGVVWFCNEIWPELKKNFADLSFYIVGSHPDPAVKYLEKYDDVVVTGFVDDIRDYYAMADVCVVPLRMARGVQNKVLEAMSMGKAVVTTSKANAGILAEDNSQLLIANDVDSFIKRIAFLLENSDKRVMLEKKAREFVVAKYDWDKNLGKLEKILKLHINHEGTKKI